MRVVLNRCFGGFSISKEAAEFMAARGNTQAIAELEESGREKHWYGYGYAECFENGYSRTDPDLVAAVEELGERANGDHASLQIIDIPDDIEWHINNYDGIETVHENHRSW